MCPCISSFNENDRFITTDNDFTIDNAWNVQINNRTFDAIINNIGIVTYSVEILQDNFGFQIARTGIEKLVGIYGNCILQNVRRVCGECVLDSDCLEQF